MAWSWWPEGCFRFSARSPGPRNRPSFRGSTVADASATQLHRLDYTLDARLNVTTIAEEVGTTPLSPDWSYGYDGASRLTSATYPVVPGLADPLPVGEQLFPYDDAGNRDDDPTDPSPWSYNANNEIEESPELRYEFDSDGNLCKWVPAGGSITTGCAAGDADETRFSFDPSNRLRRIDRPDGSVVTYRYDPFGRRLEKTVSGVTTWFVWDGDQLLGEYEGSTGNRMVRYAYARGFAPAQVASPNGSGGEDVQEVHSNHLETPRMLSDATGSAAWRSHLEAYGRAHVESSAGAVFNVRFPGQYYDGESERWTESGFIPGLGLHYNRWRSYDPGTGRYLRQDPIAQASMPNVYGYAWNQPTKWADPTGENPAAAVALGVAVGCGAVAIGLGMSSDMAALGRANDLNTRLSNLEANARVLGEMAAQACEPATRDQLLALRNSLQDAQEATADDYAKAKAAAAESLGNFVMQGLAVACAATAARLAGLLGF